MASAGDGSLGCPLKVNLSRLHAGAPGGRRGFCAGRSRWDVTAASWCGQCRGHGGRPPAVAVIGLRRSGRTGNSDGPAGASRPPAWRAAQSTSDSGARLRPVPPRREAHGALRAPLIVVEKVVTTSGNIHCRRPMRGIFRCSCGYSRALLITKRRQHMFTSAN
jgi:hypothetical protein